MTTRKYLSLAVFGTGLALAGLAVLSSRTPAPVLPVSESAMSPSPSAMRLEGAVGNPLGTAAPAPSRTPRNATEAASADFLHASLVVGATPYDLRFRAGETLYQAMQRLQASGALTIEGKDFSGIGFFIDGLNGVMNGSGKYWVYTINGVKASVGVEGYRPNAGDTLVWTFEASY